jgi:hypothetical protein
MGLLRYVGTVAGVYGYGTRKNLIFSLGKYTSVLQAEVCAIRACTVENVDKGNRNRNIYILSESPAAIETLDKY